MKPPTPLLGFNNNVRHRGRMFHIQTEDSGIKHPHVITHLFADGGRILKTAKTSYAEHIGAEHLSEIVRQLMQEQHKAMFIALRDGQLDQLFDDAPPPSQWARGASTVSALAAARSAGQDAAAAHEAARADAGAPGAQPSDEARPAQRRRPSKTRPKLEVDANVLHAPLSVRDGSPTTTLERAAATAASTAPPRQPASADGVGDAPSSPGSAKQVAFAAGGRYAQSRPAAIFATTRPSEGASIFGEDLISEKSLDEVILSYLAEDLDAPADKK